MAKQTILERIQSGKVLVSDGATGTNLQERGLALGKPGEVWVLENPEQIKKLHRDFIEAGSDIILTCTFGGTTFRLKNEGLENRAEELNRKAVELAQEAAQGTDVLVAGSIGPTGQMLKPLGTMEEEEAFAAFVSQAKALAEGGVDFFVVETQFDISEASAAVKAVRSVSSLPLVCSFSYDRGTRTMMGVNPEKMVKAISKLEVDLLGINCGRSLEDNLEALNQLRQATDLPIWFKPNAGLPSVDENGKPHYSLSPEQMGAGVPDWVAAGASVVGGCCGSSVEHIHQIALAAKS